MTHPDYDLSGIHGAEVFRDLPEGIRLELEDGAVGEIVANAGDGAWLMVKIVADENNPGRVGEEEPVFFAEVQSVVPTSEEGGR
jgi:hypothetical protein